jgi:hypothetical protein
MSDRLFVFLAFVSPLLPSIVLAWLYRALADADWRTFWIAFAVLVGVRLFFWAGDTILNTATWKLYRKRFVVRKIVDDFRRFSFPMRQDPNEDWLTYLQRVQETDSPPFEVRRAAAMIEGQMDLNDKAGFVFGIQSEGALKAALEAWTINPQRS